MPSGGLSGRAGKSLGWLYFNRQRVGNALVRASALATRNFLRHLGAALRQIGLQIFGVVFLFFALGFAYHGVRELRSFQLHGGNNSLAAIELGLALLFTYFGISSFARAIHSR
jgi:Na+/phosphate symporter